MCVLTPGVRRAASCSASAARSRTRATSAGRCREAAPARRARPSTRACTCRRCATSASSSRIGDIDRIIGANSRTPELVLGDIRGQLGADRLGERRLNELVGQIRQGENPRLLRPPVRIVGEQAAQDLRRMAGRPLRGRALRRRRRHRPGKAGAHPRRRREEGRHASISISPAPPTRPRGRPMCARRWCRRPAPIA